MTGIPPVPAAAPWPPDTPSAQAQASSSVPDVGMLAGVPHDAGVPHPARVYAYWLGTKDHYQADRETAEEVMRHRPQVRATARANRAFGRRVTCYAAQGRGIRQFLDIGAGLPAPDATHEIAQHAAPGCRAVYADNDPVVLAHARAHLTPASASAGSCGYISADVRDPAGLLDQAAGLLDFGQPVAVWLLAILHFVADEDDPARIVAKLARALAPGSLIAISHLTADSAPGPVAEAVAVFNARVPVQVYPRSIDQVTALFGKLPRQSPGVVPVARWRPAFQEAPGEACDMYGGVAVVPSPSQLPRRIPARPAGS
jgi:SAM-dependent methyltransferase